MITTGETIIIQTHAHKWVIPNNCSLLKALLEHQGLRAADLVFQSDMDCQRFIRELALLATRDSLQCGKDTSLTKLCHQLLTRQPGVALPNKH